MRFVLFCFLFLVSASLLSQQKFSKEFNFVNDNDLYASFNKDRYYTNGIFFAYRRVASKIGNLSKKIYEFKFGQEIYNPFRPDVKRFTNHDRPFAGYLYGSFGVLKAFKSNSILKTDIQLGVVGESALGRELQNIIHDIYNFNMPNGWDFQIRNTLALNFDIKYIKLLGIDKTNTYDINLLNKLRIGTIFNEITTGFMGRVGFKELHPMSNSIAYNTHLNNDSTTYTRGVESFLYYQTLLTYVLYDTTIEGSLFNDNSPITFSPNSIRFDFEIGYKFTVNKWIFGYGYHFHTNKLPNLRSNKGNVYGRLFFSYLFN